MGWEWHVADAGWERRVPDMAEVAAYGKAKQRRDHRLGQGRQPDFLNTPERAEAWMAKLEKLGIRGAKIDFFDQRDSTAEKTDDLEDTQQRLQRARLPLGDRRPSHHLLVEYPRLRDPFGRAAPLAARR